jgi:hypothetical protein
LRKLNQQRVIAASDFFNEIDPLLSSKIGPVNGREAPESGLRLRASVAPEPVVAARGNKRVQMASDHLNMVTKECARNVW